MIIPENIQFILNRLSEAGYDSYLVGGCVRDQLMGIVPHDYDIATPALPEAVEQCFQDCHVIETGLRHGTVTVIAGGQPVEITTFRCDGEYRDCRHPEKVTFIRSLEDDLARRDFTVNALAYSPKEGIVDLFGGAEDIERGIIRCVGEPDKRFNEDGLRIMRALRFASRLGFDIDAQTCDSIHRNVRLLDNIANERIFAELKGLLIGKGAEQILTEYKDVLFHIIPELAPMATCPQNNPHHLYDVWTHTVKAVGSSDRDEVIRLAMLLHDSGKPSCHTTDELGIDHFRGHPQVSAEIADSVLNRLRCDNDTRKKIVNLITIHDVRFSPLEKNVKKTIIKIGEDNFEFLMRIQRADAMGQAAASRDNTLREIERVSKIMADMREQNVCMKLKDMAINGDDLISIGVPRGKAIGQLLSDLFELVCTGELNNDRELLLMEARHRKDVTI